MTKQEFIELTGEDPEDVLGGDYESLIDDYSDEYPLGGSIERYDIWKERDMTL